MATTAASNYLSPFAQARKFFNTASDLLSSLTESTDSAFKRVKVTKRDESGNIRFFNVKDPDTGETRSVSELTYIEDIKTGDLYLDEPTYTVATKCFCVVLGMPFYTVGKMVWHAVKTPLEIGSIAIDAILKVGQLFLSGNYTEGAKEAYCTLQRTFEVLSTGLFEIKKAPFFGLGCALTALYGVFKPYHGRKFEALLENAWQQGSSHKEDFRNVPARPDENCLTAFVKDLRDSHTFYLAHCFQIRGNIRNPLITINSREPL